MVEQLYLSEIMHIIAQSMLGPTMIVILILIAFGLYQVGNIVVEVFTERRHFKVTMPEFLGALTDAPAEEVPEILAQSGLLRRQKEALGTLFENRGLPEDARIALAKRLIADEDMRYQKIVGRTDLMVRIAPMLGLMGTLIPLGPGIVAMGQGDIATLSSSLLIAFDTTVCGLVIAIVSAFMSRIRKNWYEDYMISLETGMSTILEKCEILEALGDDQERVLMPIVREGDEGLKEHGGDQMVDGVKKKGRLTSRDAKVEGA